MLLHMSATVFLSPWIVFTVPVLLRVCVSFCGLRAWVSSRWAGVASQQTGQQVYHLQISCAWGQSRADQPHGNCTFDCWVGGFTGRVALPHLAFSRIVKYVAVGLHCLCGLAGVALFLLCIFLIIPRTSTRTVSSRAAAFYHLFAATSCACFAGRGANLCCDVTRFGRDDECVG